MRGDGRRRRDLREVRGREEAIGGRRSMREEEVGSRSGCGGRWWRRGEGDLEVKEVVEVKEAEVARGPARRTGEEEREARRTRVGRKEKSRNSQEKRIQ